MFLQCQGSITQNAEGAPVCSGGWVQSAGPDLTPIDTLSVTLQALFTFDPKLFGIVIGGAAVLFSVGWGAGKVVRLLSMRING